jgi:hypothetical protein
MRETLDPGVVRRRTLTPCHCDDQSRAITNAGSLFGARKTAFHRALRSARAACQVRPPDKSPPRPAPDSGTPPPHDLLGAAQVLFY